MLIIKYRRRLNVAGISPEQDMVIKHFYYFEPVSSNLCKRIQDEAWRAALRGAAAQAARCRGYGAAGGKNEIVDRGVGRAYGGFWWEEGATWIPNAVPRWSRFLLTCFGHGGRV